MSGPFTVKEPSYLVPILHPNKEKLDSRMLSDLKIKLPTVDEKNLFSLNHMQFRPSRMHNFHLQDLSYCSDAFGSAVKVQIEMLKLVTEKKKKLTHVTSLKGITCEACECIRTPVSVNRLTKHLVFFKPTLKSRNTIRIINWTEGQLSKIIRGIKRQLRNNLKKRQLKCTRRF